MSSVICFDYQNKDGFVHVIRQICPTLYPCTQTQSVLLGRQTNYLFVVKVLKNVFDSVLLPFDKGKIVVGVLSVRCRLYVFVGSWSLGPLGLLSI